MAVLGGGSEPGRERVGRGEPGEALRRSRRRAGASTREAAARRCVTGVRLHAQQYVREVVLGVEVVDLAGGHQCVEVGEVVSRGLVADEEKGFAARGRLSQRALRPDLMRSRVSGYS